MAAQTYFGRRVGHYGIAAPPPRGGKTRKYDAPPFHGGAPVQAFRLLKMAQGAETGKASQVVAQGGSHVLKRAILLTTGYEELAPLVE